MQWDIALPCALACVRMRVPWAALPPWTVSPSLPQIKYQECVQLNAAIAPFDSPKHYNWKLEVVSYFESESSQAYEDCLAEHVRLLEDFHKCVSDQLVNYDDIEQWCVAWVHRLPARIPCDARLCLLAACILPLPNPHLHLSPLDPPRPCAVTRGVGDRECVGGGGRCGPPANGQRPTP